MSLKGKSLDILTPMYGGACMNNYFNSCLKLKELLLKHEIKHSFISTVNESLVQRARNRLADIYLKHDEHSHAVYIDADIGYDPLDILRMLEMDFDVVGAPCSRKEIRWDRLQRMFQRNHREYSSDDIARAGGMPVINFIPQDKPIEVDLSKPQELLHLGTGLMMIRRNVFEGFIEAYPDRWYESGAADPADLMGGQTHDFFKVAVNPETRQYDSEDYWFCQDVRALGFKIWVCPWMCTTHMGTYSYVADLRTALTLTGEIR